MCLGSSQLVLSQQGLKGPKTPLLDKNAHMPRAFMESLGTTCIHLLAHKGVCGWEVGGVEPLSPTPSELNPCDKTKRAPCAHHHTPAPMEHILSMRKCAR